MADIAQWRRDILAEGGHTKTDLGEVLTFDDEADRQRVMSRHGLDHPDDDQRMINIALFHKSDDYQRVRTYKPRLF